MTTVPHSRLFEAGGFMYLPAVFQYSGGVAAAQGFAMVRQRFSKPLPLAEAFAAVEQHLAAIGRPTSAFAHCELRSPAPFSEQGFVAFNRVYVQKLQSWGLFAGGDSQDNPVARTNVCPVYDPPAEPAMYAFSYTVPAGARLTGGFMVAGSGEASEKAGEAYRERIVALHDNSPEGLVRKVDYVLETMRLRLAGLGFKWSDANSAQIYTVQNIGHLVGPMMAARGIAPAGLCWHYARPPVQGLDYEMDVHGAAADGLIRP